jgi:hypothetical protein
MLSAVPAHWKDREMSQQQLVKLEALAWLCETNTVDSLVIAAICNWMQSVLTGCDTVADN